MHSIGNVDVVGAGLRDDHHTHHGHSIHLHVALDVACREFRTAHIAEADDTSVLFFDDQIVELLCGVHLAHRAYRHLGGISFDGAGWEFYVLSVECVFHIHGCHAIA